MNKINTKTLIKVKNSNLNKDLDTSRIATHQTCRENPECDLEKQHRQRGVWSFLPLSTGSSVSQSSVCS